MRSIKQVLALGTVALAAACGDQEIPTHPVDLSTLRPAFAIAAGGSATNHNGTNGNSSFLSITAPAVNAGDVLIAHIALATDISPTQVICTPAGWTPILRTNHDSNDPVKFKVVQQSFYYVATATQAATAHTWQFKTSAASCGTAANNLTGKGASGGIIRYTGVDPVNPIDAFAEGGVRSTSGTTATAPSVTTTVDGAQILRLFSAFKNLTFNETTPPTRIFSLGSGNNSSERTAAAYHTNQASAGPTSTFAVGLSTSAEWLAQTIALRPGATVRVTKVVVNDAVANPADDAGRFNLQINGTTRAANVGHQGTTGVVTVSAGSVTVGELAGTSTSLDDYVTVVSCGVKGSSNGTSHTFNIAAGEDITCTITNTRKATLTVTKALDPTGDPGKFNLQIDGVTAGTGANVGHNGTTGAVKLAPGTYTVGETAGTDTDLSDYIAAIGADCAANGSITLTSGQVATCTITNTRKPTLTVTKLLSPTDDPGKFDLRIDGTVYKVDAGHNGTTGAVKLAPGSYTVDEQAGTGTSLSDYTSAITGDCAASGAITLAAGQNATCTITNTRNVAAPTTTTYFLALDAEAMPSSFSASELNESSARIGQRAQLAGFASRVGQTLTLPSGQVGDEGWFALKTIPATWASAGPTADGLRNLLAAGPGLGGGSDPEAQLDNVPDVTPLRATGLKLLIGQQVCAIVWKSDVSINYGPLQGSLKGDNRGIVAFEVLSVTRSGTGSTLPAVGVKVLDATSVCAGPLSLLTSAPAPTSSSVPMDVTP